MVEEGRPREETLDPDVWDAMRRLGHRMVEDMMAYLQTVRDRPVWQPMPDAAKEALRAPAPHEGKGAEAAYDEFVENILPYPAGNIHPRCRSRSRASTPSPV